MRIEILEDVRVFEGRQLRIKHRSASCHCDMTFSIFLPAQIEQQAVPLLWWLSGLTCNDQNFVTKAGAQRVAAELGIALIAPDTSPRGEGVPDDSEGAWDFGLRAGFYVNATQAPFDQHYQMYEYIQQELPALIEHEFNVDRSRQSIFGHSMGGHGALTLALNKASTIPVCIGFCAYQRPQSMSMGTKSTGRVFRGRPVRLAGSRCRGIN